MGGTPREIMSHIPEFTYRKLLAAADSLANNADTQEFITGNLLMRPVEWGEAHADKTAAELYETFGKQAQN